MPKAPSTVKRPKRKSIVRKHAGCSLFLPGTLTQGVQGPRLAVLNVRQAAIASATPGGVRAGYTGTSLATTSTGDPSYGTVVFAHGTQRGVIGRACPALEAYHLGGVHRGQSRNRPR